MKQKIIYNAIKTPDGTILKSNNRHDYRSHQDTTNGMHYAVDGGLEYLKRNGPSDYTELSRVEIDVQEIQDTINKQVRLKLEQMQEASKSYNPISEYNSIMNRYQELLEMYDEAEHKLKDLIDVVDECRDASADVMEKYKQV